MLHFGHCGLHGMTDFRLDARGVGEYTCGGGEVQIMPKTSKETTEWNVFFLKFVFWYLAECARCCAQRGVVGVLRQIGFRGVG